jgi:hypothetical protein
MEKTVTAVALSAVLLANAYPVQPKAGQELSYLSVIDKQDEIFANGEKPLPYLLFILHLFTEPLIFIRNLSKI